VLHIDFDGVHRMATVGSLVAPLRRAFLSPGVSPERAHHEVHEGAAAREGEMPRTLLLMSSWQPERGIGVKIATVFPENAAQGLPSVNAAYVLLSWQTGAPRAWIDGRALTLMRTAAVSALAADLLAPAKPDVLLMVGTGALSRYLIEGHLAVRDYRSVLIWGRDAAKAAAVARDFGRSPCPVSAAVDLETAARSADVICCATLAQSPLIKGSWLKRKHHLDLVGSFKPSMREADDDCLRGALIAVDTRGALSESGDLAGPIARGVILKDAVFLLGDLLARKAAGERPDATVFKSVGVALADLAVAEHLVEHCVIRAMVRREPHDEH
jgi:ornithine cyclodeaminase